MARAAHFLAFADRSRLIFDEPGRVSGFLASLSGQRIEVKLRKHSPRRTLPQNRLLWATYRQALLGMEDYSGHSTAELHEAFKVLFCPEKPVVLPGGEEVMVRSTKLLTVEEMSAFIERVLAKLAEYGLEVHESMEVS
jgi:hypothetical protein